MSLYHREQSLQQGLRGRNFIWKVQTRHITLLWTVNKHSRWQARPLRSGSSLEGLQREAVPGEVCPSFLPRPFGKLIPLHSGWHHRSSRGYLGSQILPPPPVRAFHPSLDIKGQLGVLRGIEQEREDMRWLEDLRRCPKVRTHEHCTSNSLLYE